jgi:hypothetical protein
MTLISCLSLEKRPQGIDREPKVFTYSYSGSPILCCAALADIRAEKSSAGKCPNNHGALMTENPKSQSCCKICGAKAFTTCSGCGIIMCEKCSMFEFSLYACVPPAFYCPSCDRDASINPNEVLRN